MASEAVGKAAAKYNDDGLYIRTSNEGIAGNGSVIQNSHLVKDSGYL